MIDQSLNFHDLIFDVCLFINEVQESTLTFELLVALLLAFMSLRFRRCDD